MNKVVLKFKDDRLLKGQTSNFLPAKPTFHLNPVSGAQVQVHVEDLKAIFFVKDHAGSKAHKKAYGDKVPGGGRKISVRFFDGETIIGYTTGYAPGRPGFFMVPADLKGNNLRIYVVTSATEKIEML